MKPDSSTVLDHVEIVGNNIAKRLKELGLTQEQAGVRCGMTASQVYRAINGRNPPRLQFAFALAIGLDTTIEKLFNVKKVMQKRSRVVAP